MGSSCREEKRTSMEESLLEDDWKGGFRTLPFIIGNEAFEKMASFGLMPNMVLYLMKEYHMKMTTASTLLFLWSAATNFMPLIGAIVADSVLGRFYTIGFGSVICLMGMILLWSTTIIPQVRPPPCDESNCTAPTAFQFAYLCICFGLISIGAGGIRSSSLAFGVDQLEKGGFQTRPGLKERYFGWYYASYTLSVLIALTCIVYIQDNIGWGVGFAVPAVVMLIGVSSFFLASSFYVKMKSKKSLVIGFIQVIVASYRNQNLKLSDSMDYMCYCETGSTSIFPSTNLRFLNAACIVRDPEKELACDGKANDPWRTCSVDQVEELKSLLQVIPIWISGMIMSINICQNTFPLLQAVSMDRHIIANFRIPAASFSTFAVISVILWVMLYDRVFVPVASKVRGRPVCLSTITRMGIGIFLSFLSMIVSAIVEAIRRHYAIVGRLTNPPAEIQISAIWLVPQNCLTGFAEASNVIAQIEFYFSEFPRSMSSIASSLNGIEIALANILASCIMNMIDYLTKRRGNESWISSNINEGHYDYYYLVLAGLSAANMLYFFVCSCVYGPLKEERSPGVQSGVCKVGDLNPEFD